MRWLVRVVAALPWWALYRLSDVLGWLMQWVGYRRTVITENLARAFPEKSAAARKALQRAFYRHLADVMMEVMKAFRMGRDELCRRVSVAESRAYSMLVERGGIIITGHLGNWEWAGLRVGLDLDFPHYVVYLPLKSRTSDRLMRSLRERFGNEAVPVKRITRLLLGRRERRFAASFLADQNPPPPDIQAWYSFFGRKVPVHMGPERLARRLDVPVYWAYAHRTRRGRYVIRFLVVSEEPASLPPGEVMRRYVAQLEETIRHHPEQWLWSHRRWKLSPPDEKAAAVMKNDTTAEKGRGTQIAKDEG